MSKLREAEISENLARVNARISAAAIKAGRDPSEILLIAVTKNFPVSDAHILYELGVRNFGENREHEGLEKAPLLPMDCIWHFQGQIQSNKLKSIANWAQVIHSIASLDHAKKLTSFVESKDIFIQISLDSLPNRGGIDPSQTLELIEQVIELQSLNILGLMAVAPLGQEPESAFMRLKELSGLVVERHINLSAISAGMSDDFEAAISQGATHLRIGSQILGVRAPLT